MMEQEQQAAIEFNLTRFDEDEELKRVIAEFNRLHRKEYDDDFNEHRLFAKDMAVDRNTFFDEIVQQITELLAAEKERKEQDEDFLGDIFGLEFGAAGQPKKATSCLFPLLTRLEHKIPEAITELRSRVTQGLETRKSFVVTALHETRAQAGKTTTAKSLVDKHASNFDKELVYDLFATRNIEGLIKSTEKNEWSPRLLKALEAIILETWFPNAHLMACKASFAVTTYKLFARSVHQGHLIKEHEFIADPDSTLELNQGQEAERKRALTYMSPLMLRCIRGETKMPEVADERVRAELIQFQKKTVVELLTPCLQKELNSKHSGWKGGHFPIGIAKKILLHAMEHGEHDVPLIVERIASGKAEVADILKME